MQARRKDLIPIAVGLDEVGDRWLLEGAIKIAAHYLHLAQISTDFKRLLPCDTETCGTFSLCVCLAIISMHRERKSAGNDNK